MAKKTTKSNTGKNKDNFNHEVCELKHKSIEKEINSIKEKQEEYYNSLQKSIEKLNNNLKDKIALSEKSIGEKIDILNKFLDNLRGNGKPSINQQVRNIKWGVGAITTVLIVIITLGLGGSYKGVNLNSIKKTLGVDVVSVEKVVENKDNNEMKIIKDK